MARTITINGVDKSAVVLQRSLQIDLTLGGRSTARLDVYDNDGTVAAYRPTVGQSIVIADGATTVFGGLIVGVTDSPRTSVQYGTLSSLDCADYTELMDRVLVSTSYTAGQTLRTVVDALLATYLSGSGITRDAGMSAGATLELQTFDQITVVQALNHLSQITGWVWRLKPDKTLEMFSPGSKTAAYSVTDSNSKAIDDPVRWTKTRGAYANRVIVRAGTVSQVEKTQTWTATAAQTQFDIDYKVAATRGYITSNSVTKPLGRYGVDTMLWTLDKTNNRLVRSSGATVGDVVVMTYSAQFPYTVTVNDTGLQATDGIYTARYDAPDCFDKAAATELANGFLRRDKVTPRIVTVTTRGGFELPGTTITLTFSARVISGSHLITAISITDDPVGLRYSLTCTEGSERPAAWQDYFSGLGGSTTAAASSGGTVSGSLFSGMGGHFPSEVAANSDVPSDIVVLGSKNAGGSGHGAAVMLGIGGLLADFGWSLVADNYNNSGPSARKRLLVVSEEAPGTYTWVATITEALGGAAAGTYWLLGPAGGGVLHLGDTSSGASGYGSGYRLGDIASANIDASGNVIASSGYYERGRSTRLGEWVGVTYAGGDFTASTGTWTVDSGDVGRWSYMLIGKSMFVSFRFLTTSTSATPTTLKIAIPGGFTATGTTNFAFSYNANGTAGVGYGSVSGSTTIDLYRDMINTAWPLLTNTLGVTGSACFQVA